MNVRKTLLLASMALTALALVSPATAGATGFLTKEGKPLPVGSTVTAVSFDFTLTTSSGTFTCKKTTLHYTVTNNGPNHVILEPVGKHNATGEECHLVVIFTFTVHVSDFGTNQLTFNTWGTGTSTTTYTDKITGIGHCSFHGGIAFQATNGTSTAHVETGNTITGTKVEGTCPSWGEMHGNFSLETGGTPVTADFVPTG